MEDYFSKSSTGTTNTGILTMADWKQEIRKRLACLKLDPAREVEIIEELSQHLEDRYTEALARGATPAEAELKTQAELIGSEIWERELRRLERQVAQEPINLGTNQKRNMIADIWQDMRYGARMLIKSKGVTIIAVLSLAVGIGANTLIFSIVNAILLRPRPVAQPDQLVELYTTHKRQLYHTTSYPSYLDFRVRNQVFSGLAAYSIREFKLGGAEEVEKVWGETVSGNYFDVLGVRPLKGRAFLPDEDLTPGARPVIVISYSLWQRRFNSDPDLVGKTITVNKLAFTIIGIAPPEYTGMIRGLAIDVWAPAMMMPQLEPEHGLQLLTHRGNRWAFIIGRLKPGVPLEQARAHFDLIAREMREAHPEE